MVYEDKMIPLGLESPGMGKTILIEKKSFLILLLVFFFLHY